MRPGKINACTPALAAPAQRLLYRQGPCCQTPPAVPFRCCAKVAAHLAAQTKQISLSNLDGNKLTGDPSPPAAAAKWPTVCPAQGWMQRRGMHRVPGYQPTSASRGLCPSPAFARMLWGLWLPSARGSLVGQGCALEPPPTRMTHSLYDGRCCFVPGTVIVLFAYSLLRVSPLHKAHCK